MPDLKNVPPSPRPRRLSQLKDAWKNKRSVTIVYLLLRASVILVLIAQIFNRNFENVFLCVLALFLFTFLPTFLTGLVMKVVPLGRWPRVILEGALKMAIFLGYMFLCTRFKDLHRVFEYHGAEHKTIACYEAGLPLTVENIRRQSRFHPRCGTSFMILVIIISIFLYAVLPWTSTGMRIVYKLCMFPLLVGISYEILKWAGRSDSVLSKVVSQPGLWMQRLTTFEPDDSMIEVAIAAVTPVLPEKQEEARW